MCDDLSFLGKLRILDDHSLSVRDAGVLHAVIENPGKCGDDIRKILGFPNRSKVNTNFLRLQRFGLLVDERLEQKQAVPSKYYATEKGATLWKTISDYQSL